MQQESALGSQMPDKPEAGQGAVKLTYNARTLSEVPRREKGSGSASA